MIRYLAPTPKELGHLIRGYRRQRDWTQAQLAQQAGLLPKTLSAIEAGTGHVLLANVMRCLSALEVDLYLASRLGAQEKVELHQPQVVKTPRPVAKKAITRAEPQKLPDRTAVTTTASRRHTATDKSLKERW
jgi:transcriptional regulator with XRE-family HTH domain